MRVQRRVVFIHLVQVEQVGVLRVSQDIETVAARLVPRRTLRVAETRLPELVRVPFLDAYRYEYGDHVCASQVEIQRDYTTLLPPRPTDERRQRQRPANYPDPRYARNPLRQRLNVPARHYQRPQRVQQVRHRVIRGDRGQPSCHGLSRHEHRRQEHEREEQQEAGVHRRRIPRLQRDGVRKSGEH